MMVLRSLCPRGYVTENFNWQWYYSFLTNDFLTNEGIDYLREVLDDGAAILVLSGLRERRRYHADH